jgi:hypothetical protein
MKNTNNLVKKHQSYWVLLLAVLISGTLNAKVNHYVGGFVNAGEWSLLPSKSEYKPSVGVAGGGGFLYELQAGSKYNKARFLFDVGVGVTGGMTSFLQSSTSEAILENQWDLDPFANPKMELDYVYEVKDRHDQYTDVALQIPIMVGVQSGKFYALAGVKINPHVYTKTHSSAILTTYGRNKYFNQDYRDDALLQYFTDLPIEGGIKTTFNLDIAASLEIGGRLGLVTDGMAGFDVPKRKVEFRLAGFVDYGLLDIHFKRDAGALITPNTYSIDATRKTNPMVDPEYLQMNDIMSTANFADKVNSLLVGLKFTVLFQLPEDGKCVICQDNYRSSVRHYSSRRGMQYEE